MGIEDGDALYLKVEVLSFGGIAADTVEFIASAVGGGIVGNAAYDALKAAVIKLTEKWGERSSLSSSAAANVAKLAVAVRFALPNPTKLTVDSITRESGRFARRTVWKATVFAQDTQIPEGVAAKVLVQSPDPREADIAFIPYPS